MEKKITMTVNGTTITITERDKKCQYQVCGIPNRELTKAVEELRTAGVSLAMAVKMLAQIVLK
jgi:DNA mismatch repair ATPase MutS